MSDALLEAALSYAKLGLAIFPTAGKIPRTARGFLDATADEAQVREWWGQWPDAGIGLPTGARNGLVVVDVDDAEAFEAFQRDHGRLPETEEAITPSGGRHLYFRHPRNGALVRNAAGLRGYVGVDVRADGGYVVAPPTPGYAWEVSEHDRADLPSVFLEFAAPRSAARGTEAEPILEGARNAALASLGGSMRSRGMTEAAIRAALLEENAARCHPPLPDDEVAAIAKSVSRYEPEEGPRLRRGQAPHVDAHHDEVRRVRAEARESAANTSSALRWFSAAELAAEAVDYVLPEGLPVLESRSLIFPRRSHILSAPPKAGKTTVLLQSIPEWCAAGQRVLYMTEEAKDIWLGRIKSWSTIPQSLDVVFALGQDPDELLRLAYGQPHDITVLDTGRSLLQFEDENSNSEVAARIRPWTEGQIATGSALILALHARKGGGSHGEAVAGAGAFLALVDIVLELRWGSSKERRVLSGLSRELTIPISSTSATTTGSSVRSVIRATSALRSSGRRSSMRCPLSGPPPNR
ncbi:MAG: bifunctional DNA primase/polymerase [Chloroflexota bacterium]|nr:bifunctional DNA primase/polymerase [Chloroflexota bacterium]